MATLTPDSSNALTKVTEDKSTQTPNQERKSTKSTNQKQRKLSPEPIHQNNKTKPKAKQRQRKKGQINKNLTEEELKLLNEDQPVTVKNDEEVKFDAKEQWRKVSRIVRLSRKPVEQFSLILARKQKRMVNRKALKSMVLLSKSANIFQSMKNRTKNCVPRGGGHRPDGSWDNAHR